MIRPLLVLIFLAWSTCASAQVAFDARSEGERTTGGTTLQFAHVITGSNRALFCGITSGSGLIDVSTVTADYNGTSMAVLFTNTTVNNRHMRVFRLVAPATGTNNVTFTWSGNNFLRAVCASFTGVDQADPDDAETCTDGSGGGTSSTLNVSSATNDMAMDLLIPTAGVTALSPGAGQTEVNQIIADGVGAGYNGIASSYEAGATTTTMSWGWTGFISYSGCGWNINAGGGGGGGGGAGHKTVVAERGFF